MEEKSKEKNQAVEYKKPARKVNLTADPERLRMALENLLDNAINYSQPGRRINISIHNNADSISIAIKDEGVGINPIEQPKLFQKFSRIQNPLSVEVGGTGLGLYWADKVIRLHGGSIDVKSAVDKGSTFTVHLPKLK